MQLQVYLDVVPPTGSAAAILVERTLLAQELRSDAGRLYVFYFLVRHFFTFLFCAFFSLFFFLLMKDFQMDAVYVEYLLYMF